MAIIIIWKKEDKKKEKNSFNIKFPLKKNDEFSETKLNLLMIEQLLLSSSI